MALKTAIYDSYASKDLSLSRLIEIYRAQGVGRIIYKKLSPNDNSKNQPYMGGHLTDLGFLPTGEIVESKSTSKKTTNLKRQIKYTCSLNFLWVSAEGDLYKTPDAKLIYYPQYPEVRLSGFISKCDFDMGGWMDPTKKGREQGRVLFFGIKNTGEILAYLAVPGSRIVKEVDDYKSAELTGVFNELLMLRKPLASLGRNVASDDIQYQSDLFQSLSDTNKSPLNISDTAARISDISDAASQIVSSKDLLIRELKRIHQKHWIPSKRLQSDGKAMSYTAQNGGGYTMEAELGVIPNGIAEPDYLGWEVKQFGVKRFDLINSKPLTVMTPEPNGGEYVDGGVEMFVRKYGSANTKGINNRFDFTGKHTANKLCERTGLTLVTDGYDLDTNYITNGSGSIALLDAKGNIASSWSFPKIMEHWKTKHSKAVYIPSLSKTRDDHLRSYYYGNVVRLFEGTSIIRLLKAVSEGHVYYDPGIKLENAGTNPRTKRRSQFRIKSKQLSHLYEKQSDIDVLLE